MWRSRARVPAGSEKGRLKTAICFSDGLMFPMPPSIVARRKRVRRLGGTPCRTVTLPRAGHSGCQTP
ncbi:hypothetical protein [Kingella potus]|uniref:hypothetical protein n=1 Tax=Kingella potus TaxID=265175 RepID=UPI000E1B6585|nr:hypothetical protein [Kingella potus]UOP00285.1 hypothetical protein LVJ84_10280 [Kingella potus]